MDLQRNILHGSISVEFNTGTGLVPKMFNRLREATNDVFQVNIDTEETITYKQLWYKTIRVASALQSLGLGIGKVLAIIGESDLEVYSVYFAGIFAGASVGCIDYMLKAGEIKRLLNVLKPDFIFSCRESFEETKLALDGVDFKPVTIVPNGKHPYLDYYNLLTYDPNNFSFPTLTTWDEHVIAILFSSGTTGMPKAVRVKDQNLHYTQRYLPSSPSHIIIMTQLPIYTGSAIITLMTVLSDLGTLLYGGKSHAAILEAVKKYRGIKWFNSPCNLLKFAQDPDISYEDLSNIEKLICFGACLTKDQTIYLNKKLFNNRIGLANIYGCSEVISITAWPIGSDLVNSPKIGSVGKLLNLVQLKTGDNLGPGCEGEIFVKSPFMMAGYLNNSKETAKAIDPDGWYRTGDLGYYDEDGYVYITGRIKENFKYMHVTVSPTELEAILEEHPAVFDSAVVGKPHPTDGFHPTAFVVLKKYSPPVDASELIKFVNDQVVEFKKIRGGLYFVDEIPMTNSGKKLRSELLKTILQS